MQNSQPVLNFSEAIFNGNANFREAKFLGRAWADFRGSEFNGNWTDFQGAKFFGGVDFSRAKFHSRKWTSFRGADLADNNHIIFIEAQFTGDADFFGCHFSRDANFSGAVFNSAANFSGAYFNQVARFSEISFEEASEDKASEDVFRAVSGAAFNKETDFSRAVFKSSAYFSGAAFSKKADFSRAVFQGKAEFHNLRTVPVTALVFEAATMEKPERISFHTTHLRPSWFVDVDAQKFDFSDVEWFKLPTGDKLHLEDEIEAVRNLGFPSPVISPPDSLRKVSLRKLTQACTRLMKNAEENRDYPTANEFHYWSMEAMRKEGWSRLGLIATLYWALNGYGERPRRAFWVLVVIWLVFAALYFLLANSSPFWVFLASDIWQGIDYARQAAVYSLGALARLHPNPQPEGLGWFQTLVIIEGVLGPLQIALFLLAVRRKVMR